ncbi:MAG: ABC transporter permease subunit [Acidobacteriota bacterium]
MLRHLIRKEILDSLLNHRFLALAVFSIVLMPLSAFINYESYHARRSFFDSQFTKYENEHQNSVKLRVYRPPVPLSAVARGTEAFMPLYYEFSYDGSTTHPGNMEAQEFSTLSTFGNFDLLFLVQVVFSLLAVLLSFDMVAGEKESGTLRAVLANRVPRDSILIGKLFGGFLVLWLAFLLGYLLFWLVLAASDSRFVTGARLPRMLAILVLSTLFLAAFYSLGLMVSTFCHSTRTAIVSLLVIWVGLQLIIPRAGDLIAAVAMPVRSRAAVLVAQDKIRKEMEKDLGKRAGLAFVRIAGEENLDNGFDILSATTPMAVRFKTEYLKLARENRRQQRNRLGQIEHQYLREKALQQKVSRGVALLSPASALAFLLTDTAGTGDLAFRAYRDAVQAHHQILDRIVFDRRQESSYRISLHGSTIMSSFGGGSPTDISAIPAFRVPQPSLTEILQTDIWALATLLAYLIVPFLIAFVRFMHYDVR